MNERVTMFIDNVEKIRLFFGQGAERFALSLAAGLTLRNKRFLVFEYEEVRKTIKAHSKWYSQLRHSRLIANTYYLHYSDEPQLIPEVIERQKLIKPPKVTEVEDSYIAAIYLKDPDRFEEVSMELANQPSLKFTNLPLSLRALLATRSEQGRTLAMTYENYYESLIDRGWKRGKESKFAAFLLTMGTGTISEEKWQLVVGIESLLISAGYKLEPRYYPVIALLAAADFELSRFSDLLAIETRICDALKLDPKYYHTLFIAAQICTGLGSHSAESPPGYQFDYVSAFDMAVMIVSDSIGENGSGDSGSGGDFGGGGD